MGDHCEWKNGSCVSKDVSCGSYGNDDWACDSDSNCEYDYEKEKCANTDCYNLYEEGCNTRSDCEWDENDWYCNKINYPCVSDSKMAEHRSNSQGCEDDPNWKSIDGYKCEDIGSAIIKSECSSGLLYTYDTNGVRVDDACPESCEVEGCSGSSASSAPSYVDDV